ncbi:hypothetical protein H7E67_10490 [Clostridium gasigenes]|uniref:hypothetical protein n=1 Tax=Clostridium gasigenes TaxID=94869 RepID=UPI001629F4FB|nr:hypothetical protein [Clostridium gasigenes]MBB6623855.1 hypothetical protein [Clostridium gasigenes]
MKGISLTLNNKLVFNKEFYNRKEKREVNKFIGGLDKKIYKTLVFTIATFGFCTNKAYASIDDGLKRTDTFFEQLLTIIQRVGFWVAVVGCLVEILVSVFKKGGGQKEIINIVFKWLLIFSCFYIVPALFRWIATVFI